MRDFPKIESPFVRTDINGHYIVTPQIAEGYEWVFEDPEVIAGEKLNGTNVSIGIHAWQLVGLFNRLNPEPFGTLDSNRYIQGVRAAYAKGRVPPEDGQYFGELMGPEVHNNFLKLDSPMWYPFDYIRSKFYFNSWGKYPKDFDTISKWFQNDIFSIAYMHYHEGAKVQPEGIVFYQPSTGRMAKLRLDMFEWFKGSRHGGRRVGEDILAK